MEVAKNKILEDIIEKLEHDIDVLEKGKIEFKPINAKERGYLKNLNINDANILLKIDDVLLYLRQYPRIVNMTNPMNDVLKNACNKTSLRCTKNALEKIKKDLENLKPETERIDNLKNRTIKIIEKLINYINNNLE